MRLHALFFICKKFLHKLDYMKKWSKKRVFGLIKRLIVGVLVIVLIIVLPAIKTTQNQDLGFIYEKFIGKKSDYQGMIEIWNIDTFEGANISKTKLISQITAGFQQENKGIYFMVRNVSENECKNLIASGQFPDIFSCSYGVAESIKSYAMPLSGTWDIYNNFLSAGQDELGSQLGVPWCFGSYYLISTQNRISQAGKGENVSLLDVCLDSGYVKSGKKEVVVYSLELGLGKYSLPQRALSAYYNNGEFLISDKTINKESVSQSAYSAYCNFVAGKSTILLGTNRDVFRVKNREQNGKLADVVIQPLERFSDLVQFAFAVDSGDGLKNKYIQNFVEYMVQERAQQQVLKSGLFSTSKGVKVAEESGVMKDITPNNISSYEIFNVFLSKTEIEKLQHEVLSL